MRIGIDGQFWGARDRGIGVYTENLIKNLKEIDPPAGEAGSDNQYFIFDRKMSGWKRQLLLPFILKKQKLDLMHFTTYFNVPILYQGKFVITIHDLIFSHVNFFKRIIYKIILKLALKRAKKIIAVSNYTKQEILKNYRINSEKIEVIYEGVK